VWRGKEAGRAGGKDSEVECLGKEGERAGLDAEQDSEPRTLESLLDPVFWKFIYFYLSHMIYLVCWRCC